MRLTPSAPIDAAPINAAPIAGALLAAALSAVTLLASGGAHASDGARMTDARLRAVVGQRLHGDRTGACFATAVIAGDSVSRAYVCADGQDAAPRIDADTAFEIGSVSKPMMAALLAGLIREGKAALDDPLSAYLPEGTRVPAFEGNPILLRHLVTHTSGLPPLPAGMAGADLRDPYAALDDAALLRALSGATLQVPPGSRFEYSNFAAMLLSYAIARRAGGDFETLARTRLFAPLGMDHTYVAHAPAGVKAAAGHLPDGTPASPWTFPPDLAGVGGVRATLDDMVRYVQGQFGDAPAPLDADLRMTHAPLANAAKAPIAMHWMLAPLNGRTFLAHEGGTGGFSSFVAFDPVRRDGVVILSDTALHAMGGLGSLGLHLLDARVPLGTPARAEPARDEAPRDERPAPASTGTALSQDALAAYAGEYPLMPSFALTVRAQATRLTAQATGQGAFPLTATAPDVFAAPDFGIVIRFQRDAAGKVVSLTLEQGGQVMRGQRK